MAVQRQTDNKVPVGKVDVAAEQILQTSQCWTLKELAKNIWDRP
ncbi:transposase, ISL3 family domain protein [Klebsiella oxytoca]|nr:transposase, ISL3 family domain protein [Klebsiella oxytoca]